MSKNMFEYRIVPGDPTIGDVRNREKFYGYTKCSPLYLNESFRELYNAIISDQSIMSSNNFKVSLVSEKYLKDSITIWENLGIRLQEIDMIIESEAAKEGMFIIDQKFLDGIKSVHPFELPIKFINDSKIKMLDGKIEFIEIAIPNNSERNSVLYKNISLTNVNNELTVCAYNHEIAHTQSGGYTSILDTETIPIFIGDIFANKVDSSGETLKTIRYYNLLSLATMLYKLATFKNIAFISKIRMDTYIKSILQGIKLANTYLFGTPEVQKEMINYVNQIFSENLSAMDMLEKFECDFSNVSKDINVLKLVK